MCLLRKTIFLLCNLRRQREDFMHESDKKINSVPATKRAWLNKHSQHHFDGRFKR
jgi:hypothetical protein